MFKKEKLSSRVYRIIDPLNVSMYLLIGEKKACLIDTGYGIEGLRDYVLSIIGNKECEVLLSHGHIDHAMGAPSFNKCYMNTLDYELYLKQSNIDFRKRFIKNNLKIEDCQLISGDACFLPLNDQDIFDLGGLTVKAIHVPGHTLGMMMFLIQEEKMMIFGDACGPGTILLGDESTNISTYYNSLKRIKEYENQYDYVLRNHGTHESNKDLLDNVLEVLEDVLDGNDDKVELPSEVKRAFNVLDKYHIYQAKKTILNNGHSVRIDGKEGNVSYREDKVQ